MRQTPCDCLDSADRDRVVHEIRVAHRLCARRGGGGRASELCEQLGRVAGGGRKSMTEQKLNGGIDKAAPAIWMKASSAVPLNYPCGHAQAARRRQ